MDAKPRFYACFLVHSTVQMNVWCLVLYHNCQVQEVPEYCLNVLTALFTVPFNSNKESNAIPCTRFGLAVFLNFDVVSFKGASVSFDALPHLQRETPRLNVRSRQSCDSMRSREHNCNWMLSSSRLSLLGCYASTSAPQDFLQWSFS